VYSRLHLDVLFLYWGLGDEQERRLRLLDRQALHEFRDRLTALKPYYKPTAALIVAETVILLVGAYIYVDAGRPEEPQWWWREGGLVATLDAGQLLAASAFGLAAYITFLDRRVDASRSEAAGIFFWAIGALGLAIFAFDDYFTVHERLGDWLINQLHFVPVVTNVSSDMLIIGYAVGGLATLFLFRMEIFSGRPSATLLQLAAVSSVVMVLVDGFGTTDAIKVLEFPTQTFACTLLMLAFLVRWLEVRQAAPAANGVALREAKA
jgi:hypothetical protein